MHPLKSTFPQDSLKKWGIWSYRLPLNRPLAVLGDQTTHREGWIVGQYDAKILDWKFGEVAPLPSFHGLSIAEVYQDIQRVLRDHQPAHTALVQTVLDIWTLQAQAGSLKVNALWDPSTSSSISFAISPSRSLPTTVVKIKLGRKTLSEEAKTFRQLQEAYPQLRWRIDCNRQWSIQDLQYFWTECDPQSIDYIEDPLQDPLDMLHFPEIPFALDESLISHASLLQYAHVRTGVIKPTLHRNWRKIVDTFPNKPMIFSSTFEGSLGIWGLAQLALQHASNQHHGLDTLSWFSEECMLNPLSVQRNQLEIVHHPPMPDFEQLLFVEGE